MAFFTWDFKLIIHHIFVYTHKVVFLRLLGLKFVSPLYVFRCYINKNTFTLVRNDSEEDVFHVGTVEETSKVRRTKPYSSTNSVHMVPFMFLPTTAIIKRAPMTTHSQTVPSVQSPPAPHRGIIVVERTRGPPNAPRCCSFH